MVSINAVSYVSTSDGDIREWLLPVIESSSSIASRCPSVPDLHTTLLTIRGSLVSKMRVLIIS